MGFFSRSKNKTATAPSLQTDVAQTQTAASTPKPERESSRLGSLFMGDRVIWVVFFFLCIISLVEVYSAASTLAYKSGRFWSPLSSKPCSWA